LHWYYFKSLFICKIKRTNQIKIEKSHSYSLLPALLGQDKKTESEKITILVLPKTK